MQAVEKLIIRKPYRKLLRTQNSLQKMMSLDPDSHLKKVKKLIHRQLKDSFRNESKMTSFHATKTIAEQLAETRKKTNPKSKSHVKIFRNAHVISSCQTFIKPKKNRRTIEKEFLQKRLIQQRFSYQRFTTLQNFQDDLTVTYDKIKIIDNKQCQSTIEKEQLRQFRKISKDNLVGESEPVDKDAKSRKKSYSRHLRVYSQNSQAKFQTQLSVPTVRMGQQTDQTSSNNVLFNPLRQPNEVREAREQQVLNQQLFSQQQLASPERRELSLEQADEAKTTEKVPEMMSELKNEQLEQKLVILDSNEKSSKKQVHFSKHQQSKQEKYYLQTEGINEFQLQEVQFHTIESIDRNKRSYQNIMNSQVLNNPYLPWESSKKEKQQLSFVNIHDKSAIKDKKSQSPGKKKDIKIKSAPKIVETKQSSNFIANSAQKQIKNQDFNEKHSLKTESFETKQPKQHQNQYRHTTNESKQIPKNLPQVSNLVPFKPNLAHIRQKMQMINKFKEQLQMFSEMATYFSKKSKIFKQNAAIQPYLREKGGFKWHKLIFLAFKFAYFNFQLFEVYFRWGSTFIKVNQSHLSQFSQENQIWAETLLKVEKSVRKNMQITPSDKWISTNFPPIPDDGIDKIMEEILILKNGKSQCYTFMVNLANLIFDESANLLKSVFISKFLKESNDVTRSIRQGLLRIVNTCIILQGYFRDRPQIKLQPITNLQQFENPSLEIFKQSYNKLIHEIFSQ